MPFKATMRVFLGILRVTERVETGVPFVVQWTSASLPVDHDNCELVEDFIVRRRFGDDVFRIAFVGLSESRFPISAWAGTSGF